MCMANLFALWFLGCGLGMCRACAAGVAVRQPQQCYRAGTSLLHYKASSVSSFPPETRPSQTQVPSVYIQGQLSLFTESPGGPYLSVATPVCSTSTA